jgi:hypothetical protein
MCHVTEDRPTPLALFQYTHLQYIYRDREREIEREREIDREIDR